jgi:hypothetical protein
MLKIRRSGWLIFLALFTGCGGDPTSTSNPGKPPPHGGTLIALPGGKGLIEVVRRPSEAGKGVLSSEISFYFYEDAYTPYSPAPTSGTLTVNKNKKIALKAEADALVSPTGPPLFSGGDFDGSLTVELDGKVKTIPLGIR